MNYNLKGTGISITDDIRAYLEKRLAALDKFVADDSAARVDVELEYIASEEKHYRAEFMLHDKIQLRAEANGSSLYEAIDVAAGELSSELSRAKKKRLQNFRHSAVKVKEFLRGWRRKI